MKRIKIGILILILFLGSLIGSAFGELIGYILPDGVVKDFFLTSVDAGIKPTTIDLNLIKFTLGFTFKLNVMGIVGVIISAYILKWYRY
jgi:uncharacterized membrane protein